MMLLKQCTWILCALLLSACTSFPTHQNQTYEQSQLADLHRWEVRGKLSVTTPEESNSGYLTWKQNNSAYDLFIAGPFGTGASRLYGDDEQAHLLLSGWDKPQSAPSADVLMQVYLGWNFPVADIRYWVKGQASPNSEAISEFNQQGLLETLTQHGWEIRYSRYQLRQGVWVPGLIRMSGHNFRFTFAIQEWSFNG